MTLANVAEKAPCSSGWAPRLSQSRPRAALVAGRVPLVGDKLYAVLAADPLEAAARCCSAGPYFRPDRPLAGGPGGNLGLLFRPLPADRGHLRPALPLGERRQNASAARPPSGGPARDNAVVLASQAIHARRHGVVVTALVQSSVAGLACIAGIPLSWCWWC